MRDLLTRCRSWAVALGLLVLTGLNVAQMLERPRVAEANFSDSVLFDHREYWERCLTTAYPYSTANNWLPQLFATDSIGLDLQLPYVFSINQTSDGKPATKKAMWVGENMHNGTMTDDPFAAQSLAENGGYTWNSSLVSQMGLWGRVSIMESICALDSATVIGHSGDKAGIALGHLDTLAFAINGSGQFISRVPLCALYARLDNNTWELLLNKGGGTFVSGNGGLATRTVGTIAVLAGVEPPYFEFQHRLRLVYNPVAGYVAAIVNGVEGARITDKSKFPSVTGFSLTGFSCFAMSGVIASTQINMAFWYPTIRTYYGAP